MPRNGATSMTWNEEFFATISRTPGIVREVDAAAERVMAQFQKTAPRDTGEYVNSAHIEHHHARYRDAARVEVDDPKALIIESKKGTLARALKAAKG